MIKILKLSLLFACTWAHAGDLGLQDGTDFANAIKPSDNSHLVNPSALNQDNAWGSGIAPTAVPSGMGAFSNPVNDNSIYNSAKGIGIAGLGLQTQADCANYVPGQSKEKDQQCAAVNFMSNRCTPVSATQMEVFKKIPRVSGASNDCNGTYGQGASMFNYASQMTKKDNIFNNANGARMNAGNVAGANCSVQDVQTSPAQFQTNTCSVTRNVTEEGCSKFLSVNVSTSFNCVVNTWAFTNYSTWNNPNNKFYLYSMCDHIDTNRTVNLLVGISAAGACGATSYNFQLPAYTPVSQQTPIPGAPAFRPDFYGVSGRCRITVTSLTYTHNGCVNNNCQTTVYYTSDRGYLTQTTLTYQPYKLSYTETDVWDNQCKSQELRAQ